MLLSLGPLSIGCTTTSSSPALEEPAAWVRHTIDDSSRGADGVRLDDVNGDGLLDITTGWEQGGVIRVYLNPGPAAARQQWPAVTVGEVGSPEDAVFVDLDDDGAVDVVSSCEGKTRTMFVHWAPKDDADYLNADAWETAPIPASQGRQQWMFALPLDIDGNHGIDLVAGSKNDGGQIGWWESPENPRDLASWQWHPLYDAGWIMSLIASDMDADGDLDIVATDRKGANRGALWLENPGRGQAHGAWPVHRIGSVDEHEVMFMDLADLDADGLEDALVPDRTDLLLYYRRTDPEGDSWQRHDIRLAPNIGLGKAVEAADVDLDGKLDIVFSCGMAKGDRHGVMWISYDDHPTESRWAGHPISGSGGVKFDLVKLIDLDGDGDLDVLTCEEVDDLGVFWYENPTRS